MTRTLIRRPRSPWAVAGYVLVIIAVVGGLALLAAMILVSMALSQMGTNK